ncbi:MAG: GNAT family N-acetyltransferase [Caldilineaceae bacterium]|nr:GNAT family N-acetyltransferase [Caldilineaceae bacterium]MDE0338251.1 GNAT family N-acetyltransferase [Caldilineaceae bacterium]
MTNYTVRRFGASNQEYEDLSRFLRIVAPERRPESAEELRQEDGSWPEESLHERVAAYSPDRKMAGLGTCYEAYWQDSPSTVHVRLDIDPDHEKTHLLPLLYQEIQGLLELRNGEIRRLVSGAREDDSARVHFLQERGFREKMRSPSSALRIENFDGSACDGAYKRLAQEGIRLITLAQLYEEEPEWKRKLRDLRWAIVQDVPSTEPFAEPSVEEFEEMVLKDPALEEEAFFVALSADGKFVGMSNLWRNDPAGKRLDTGLTGVIRSYRRRGIAAALKMRTIQYAQTSGAETIETSNEEGSPMLALNLKLGFEPKPAWIEYVLDTSA